MRHRLRIAPIKPSILLFEAIQITDVGLLVQDARFVGAAPALVVRTVVSRVVSRRILSRTRRERLHRGFHDIVTYLTPHLRPDPG
jgi:hypothetical protein